MKVTLFMPTMNRLEFTKRSIEELFRQTNASYVEEFLVVDGRSEDGTVEWVRQAAKNAPYPSKVVTINERHVVNAMITARDQSNSSVIAKVDSDTMVSKDWLEIGLEVLQRHSDLWALGVHGRGFLNANAQTSDRNWKPAVHVGGIGLFRKQAWEGLRPVGNTYYGWTGHQHRASWKKGWLDPGLPVFLLNLLRFQPFLGLSEDYIRRGWQRKSEYYRDDEEALWSWRFPNWRESV